MIRIERTEDWDLIKVIATHPKVYPAIADDFSPKAEDWQPIRSQFVYYLLAWDENELLGMWVLMPENGVCWDVHTCLLPAGYGERGLEAAKTAREWVFANTQCRRLITHVPIFNRLALKFAIKSGMTAWGKNPQSYQKGGILYDQVLLGMSRN